MMKPNSAGPLRFIPSTRRFLSALSIVLSFVLALAAFGVPVSTSWTYQGQLRRSGAAYNGTCNFQFSLWDALSAGTQKGSTQSINGVNVANGLFTVVLDFGNAFKGEARWLGTSVQCSEDGGFTPLDPRQPITATPYALSLVPGANVRGPLIVDLSFQGTGTGTAVIGSGGNEGVAGYGHTGVYGSTQDPGGAGVFGEASDPADSASKGVFGANSAGSGICGLGRGVGPAIFGQALSTGFAGQFVGAVLVEGPLTVKTGVLGQNRDAAGIWGLSTGSGPAIYGQATSTGLAGRFTGHVVVEGNLIVQGVVSKGGGNFRIDHPLDPANKFLSHSFVESPDMMNLYNGNVTTDATGSATVTLPDYFAALNRDYRYQLTVLGQFAQAIVSRKIAGNSFEIRTDKPGVEVSWQVTGVRQDAYAQANPIVVEQSKPAEEQGLYLFPAGFGAGKEKQIGYSSRPAMPQTEQKITK